MYDNGSVSGVSGVSKLKMVFTDTVINAYSDPYKVNADNQTQSTMKIATLVNCKTLPTNVTGLNGLTPQNSDYMSNPLLGCMAYNSRGEGGSTIELFG